MFSETSDPKSRNGTIRCDHLCLPGGEWSQATMICGGLGIVLGVWGQSTEFEVSMTYNEDVESPMFSINLEGDDSVTVGEYLANVAEILRTSMLDDANLSCFAPAEEQEQQMKNASTTSHLRSMEIKIIFDEECICSARSSIWLRCGFEESQPSLLFTFAENHYDPTFVKHISQQICHVAGGLTQSTTLLRNLNLLSSTDEQEIRRWTPTPALSSPSCVHLLVEKQVMRSPNALAVDSWDGKLTYGELHKLSSHLAVQLSTSGIPDKSVIPLLFEKSMWTVVAMIAVLKSGHAFLLLDASNPIGRLEMLVQDVKGPLVISSETQDRRAAVLADHVIVVSATRILNDTVLPLRNQENVAEPHDLALVVFTSGTTGRPKATAIEHHSICSGLTGLAERVGVSETSRYYQFSSYAWDAAFGEILMTLFSGGCICVPTEEDRMNRLAQSMTELNANFVLLTPTVLRLLSPQEVPTMRNIIMGGEKVTRSLVQTWSSSVRLTTVYAPAECTVACMVNQQFGQEFDPALIGSAFGCRVWITLADSIERLAPVGVPGELLIEGPNVARGYLNDLDRTAKSFISTPPRWMKEMQLNELPYSRIYRTGDLVRYNSEGKIVFVGRRDYQVKLRGQRIELQEVQSQIHGRIRLPGAQVFIDTVDPSAEQNLPTLTAFIHSPEHRNKEGGLDVVAAESERLRLDLATVLPAFMVPTLWIPIPVIPLSTSGKLDRRVLVQFGKEFLLGLKTAPRKSEQLTEAQRQLSTLWAEVLSTHPPGLVDNFFLLGGDSVKAMQLVSLAQRLRLRLSVKDIFRHPSLAAMSSVVEHSSQNESSESTLTSSASLLSSDDFSKSLNYLAKLGYGQNDIVDIFPCTQLQEGMFLSSLGVPGSYISQYIFSPRPSMAMEKFKKAWEDAATIISILRMRFVLTSTGLSQAIVQSPLQWTTTTGPLSTYLESDRQRAFALGEPLARYCIVEDLTSRQSHLVWTLHHSIFDGWSLDKIFSYVRRNSEDGDRHVDALESDFSKFVNFTQCVDTEDARDFWLQQLLNAPAPSFPAIPQEATEIADRSCVTLTTDASRATKKGVTFMILARAALSILLCHYENSDDVIFGNTIHGRNSLPPEMHNVIGPTLSTLPVRVKVDRNQAISRFLTDLHEQFIATIPYEQYGLLRIREINRNTRSSSSFRVLLIIQNPDSVPYVGDDVEVQEAFRCLHEYPVVITLTPDPKQVEMSWTFDDNVLHEGQVRAFALQFEQALNQLCSVADSTRICELDLTSQFDKARLFNWNAVHHKPITMSVIELIDTQIKQIPRAMAIDAWDGRLSYESLDRISSIFAAELVHMGVRPNTLVGHCFEKSSWALVALVAIMKAGGAFAPFSPGHPKERLLNFTQDAGIQLILCSSQQQQSLAEGPWEIVVVDGLIADKLSPDPGVLPTSVSPDSLIYALQTSGTTGQPKTFPVRHGAFATGIITRESLIQRGQGNRVLQFGPYTFRLGIENILGTLAAGGCVCIPSDKDIMDDLSGYIGEAKITFANVTPSMARTLEVNKMPTLQVLLLSGEPPDRDLIRTWAGRVQLINGYGPSEFTAKQTLNFNMTEDDPHNLGRAVGASLWVVDPDNQECLSPLGAVGELLIEGPTLADGYINRPLEMEKRFIATPIWLANFRKEKTTVFKTGDLVKYNIDGSLTSVGRADGQVKLHGQRFEAKEVEHHIKTRLSDQSLDILVDIIRFKGHDSDVVAAFVTSKKHKLQNTIEVDSALSKRFASEKRSLVDYLSRLLPSYMIPSIFLGVSIIPVTANGKADRRALKTFGSQLSFSGTNTDGRARVVRRPQSEEEINLHRLWQELMRLEENQFGLDDHFFELGGTSMTAIRLVTLAREAQLSLTAQAIFKNPMLKDMALQLKKIQANPEPTSVPGTHLLEEAGFDMKMIMDQLPLHGLSENDIEDMYPCLDLQGFYMKKALISPGSTTYQHLYKLPDDIDIRKLEYALEQVFKATPSLRTRVISVSGKLVQLVCKEEFTCRRFVRLDLCFKQDRDLSWELGAPLSRFSIVHDEQNGHGPDYLVWSSNHVIWDQWSRNLIWQDIDYAYQHDCLPSTRPTYRDFIAHVVRQKRSDTALESSILAREYIGRQFAALSPLNWSQRDARSSRKMTMTIELPTPDQSNLSHSCLLLTSWTLAVAIVEKSNDILTVNEVNGRSSDFPGVEELAGPVVGALPLCVGLQNRTVLEHAVLVQNHTIEGLAVQHTVGLDEHLVSQMESMAYWVLINDQDGYEEPATNSLHLRRCRAEKIAVGVWPFYLTFNVHPRNTRVEIEAIFALDVASVEKVAKLFASLKLLLSCIFAPGGLQINTADLRLSVNKILEDGSSVAEVMATVPVESRSRDPQYNPYS